MGRESKVFFSVLREVVEVEAIVIFRTEVEAKVEERNPLAEVESRKATIAGIRD
jgi:hypothetical protein